MLARLVIPLAVIVTVAGACHGINPSLPSVVPDPMPVAPPSSVSVPVTMPLASLQAMAEASVPTSAGAAPYNEAFGTGGPDEPSCGFNAGYAVDRSPISITGAGSSLTTAFSVSYGATVRHRVPCPGALLEVSCGWGGEPRRTATMSLTTDITIDRTWGFASHSRSNGVQAGNRCKVSIFNIDVTDKITGKLGDQLTALAGALDQRIVSAVQLRDRAEVAWTRLQTPLRLTDNAHLMLHPDQAGIIPLTFDGGVIRTGVWLSAHPEILLGRTPTPGTVPLPTATPPSGGDVFVVVLPVSATYGLINQQLRKLLKLDERGYRYPPVGKRYITVTDVEVYGYGKQAVVRVGFKGSAKGTMYLTGTPSYDVLNDVLSFPDLDFTVETRNLLVKAANWFAHDTFRDDLRQRLALKLGDQLNTAKQQLSTALNSKVGEVQLSGSAGQLNLLGVYADARKGTFEAMFQASGTLRAALP